MALDPAWIGVIGTGIGALASGLPSLGSAVVQSVSARGQRKHDAEQAKVKRDAEAAEATTQREHEETMRRRQVAADLLVERKQRLMWWRERLQVARNMHEGWEQRGNDVPPPNIVGDEWFETLRPHLAATGNPGAIREVDLLACDHATLVILSLEIGRIEREWIAEAQGYHQIPYAPAASIVTGFVKSDTP